MGARLPALTLLALCGGLLACAARDQSGQSSTAAEAEVTAAPEAAATAAPSPAQSIEPLDVTWQWVSLDSPGEQVEVDKPERYTVRFGSDGRLALRADCNQGGGSYAVDDDGRLELGPLALTKMACSPGSLSDRFVRELGRATKYSIKDGELFLALPADSGTLRFRRAS